MVPQDFTEPHGTERQGTETHSTGLGHGNAPHRTALSHGNARRTMHQNSTTRSPRSRSGSAAAGIGMAWNMDERKWEGMTATEITARGILQQKFEHLAMCKFFFKNEYSIFRSSIFFSFLFFYISCTYHRTLREPTHTHTHTHARTHKQ